VPTPHKANEMSAENTKVSKTLGPYFHETYILKIGWRDQAWLCTHINSAGGWNRRISNLRPAWLYSKFHAGLGYTVRPYLKKQTKKQYIGHTPVAHTYNPIDLGGWHHGLKPAKQIVYKTQSPKQPKQNGLEVCLKWYSTCFAKPSFTPPKKKKKERKKVYLTRYLSKSRKNKKASEFLNWEDFKS
jgi:hypothetical protein